MRLRELIKVTPIWTNICIRDEKGVTLGLNGSPAGYKEYLKEEVLNAEVIEIEIRQPENYKDTLDVKIKTKEEKELQPGDKPKLEIKQKYKGTVEVDTAEETVLLANSAWLKVVKNNKGSREEMHIPRNAITKIKKIYKSEEKTIVTGPGGIIEIQTTDPGETIQLHFNNIEDLDEAYRVLKFKYID